MKILKTILIIILSVSLSSCIIVKNEEESQQKAPVLKFSPTPELKMSDEMVRSDEGDMVAFLPEDWFLVNLQDDVPVDVFGVAVNKEYTISIVFNKIRKTEKIDKIISREGAMGLARIALERRAKKTAGSVELAGEYSEIEMGPRKFAKYEFTNADKSMRGMSAVFISTLGNYYEISVIPMNLTGIVPVSQYDLKRVFSSVLATAQF
jgi:hypothetical protein